MPQITQLDNDPTPNNNDLLVTVDVEAGTTKNISREQFFTGAPLPANTVDSQAIADGAVTSQDIADGAVTPEKRSGGFYAASVTIPAGTGNKTLTGFGFKPKEVQFIANYTSTAIYRSSIGGAVDLGGGNFFQYASAGVARATGNSTDSMTVRCLRIVDSSNALLYAASFVSFDADGITLTVNNDDPNFRTWFVIARA